MRQHRPENLHRTPGLRAILYYLHRDQEWQAQGPSLPRAPRTVWKILSKLGGILDEPHRSRRPQARAAPMEEIQRAFQDATSVPPDPDGKQQQMVELLTRCGRPCCLTCDRESRGVGSHSRRHFPAAFCRFLLCLDIPPTICPPRRPDKHASVEGLHRTLHQACVQIHLPTTRGEVREATQQFPQHDTAERPHQATACGTRRPSPAFPTLPALPPGPECVDPDRWLATMHGRALARTVGAQGRVEGDEEHDSISQAGAGCHGVLFVKAPEKVFGVWLDGRGITSLARKGLAGRERIWQD